MYGLFFVTFKIFLIRIPFSDNDRSKLSINPSVLFGDLESNADLLRLSIRFVLFL
jgi:hypothetical protein